MSCIAARPPGDVGIGSVDDDDNRLPLAANAVPCAPPGGRLDREVDMD